MRESSSRIPSFAFERLTYRILFVHDFTNSGKKLRDGESSLMWGRGGSERTARHRAYTWGMANNDQGYDPFEPGHSTPEFEQFARENQKFRKANHAR